MATKTALTKTALTKTALIKTGEVRFLSEDGFLWLAESFVNADGVTSTQQMLVDNEGSAAFPETTEVANG